jgi:hypothetical protein
LGCYRLHLDGDPLLRRSCHRRLHHGDRLLT